VAGKKKRGCLIVLLILVILLVIVRLIMPTIILNKINDKLHHSKNSDGQVEDIDLALIRGAYKIKGIRMVRKDSITGTLDSIPMFECPLVDLSVQWGAIFHGKIVGEVVVEKPELNIVKGRVNKEKAKQDTSNFRDAFKKLMPLTLNRIEINDATIRYFDPYSKPVVDMKISNLQLRAENISNVNDSNKVLPSHLQMSAMAYDGTIKMNVKFSTLEQKPTFDLTSTIEKVNLVKLNAFFKAYGNFELSQGTFGLYTEMAAKEGLFKGYVKPVIDSIKVKKGEGTALDKLWEAVVSGATNLLKNGNTEKVATKLPIEGRFENPRSDLWTAVAYVLRNAFVAALRPSIDNEINIENVKQPVEKEGFFKKLFKKKDKEDSSGGKSGEKSKK
jgi:hypothetical protein